MSAKRQTKSKANGVSRKKSKIVEDDPPTLSEEDDDDDRRSEDDERDADELAEENASLVSVRRRRRCRCRATTRSGRRDRRVPGGRVDSGAREGETPARPGPGSRLFADDRLRTRTALSVERKRCAPRPVRLGRDPREPIRAVEATPGQTP